MNKDDLVLKLMEKIKNKKIEILNSPKIHWKTNCTLNISGNITNLKTITSTDKCVEIFSQIVQVNESYKKSYDLLGIKSEEKIQGYYFEDWLNDFKIVAENIKMNLLKQKLIEDENTLSKLLSQNKKDELKLEALMLEYKD